MITTVLFSQFQSSSQVSREITPVDLLLPCLSEVVVSFGEVFAAKETSTGGEWGRMNSLQHTVLLLKGTV